MQLCTHGVSLMPLIQDPTTPIKPAAYSQYPRGYQRPGEENEETFHQLNLWNGDQPFA